MDTCASRHADLRRTRVGRDALRRVNGHGSKRGGGRLKPLVTAKELAALLGLPVPSLYYAIRTHGELPTTKVGRAVVWGFAEQADAALACITAASYIKRHSPQTIARARKFRAQVGAEMVVRAARVASLERPELREAIEGEILQRHEAEIRQRIEELVADRIEEVAVSGVEMMEGPDA